jgi:hypothetical protein
MEHVVFYPSSEGVPAFERVASLEAAVNFVEQLRNSMNITEFSVHALTPVPLSFRAYYHVEVPASANPAATPDEDRSAAWVAEAAFAEPSGADIPAAEPAAVPAWDSSAIDPGSASPSSAEQFAGVASGAAGSGEPEPVGATVGTDVVPEDGGRKSLGFFTR